MKKIFTLLFAAASLTGFAQVTTGPNGLWFDGTDFNFVTLDPVTAVKSNTAIIPLSAAVMGGQLTSSSPTFYLFIGFDQNNQKNIYTVDIAQGTHISAALNIDMMEPEYNCFPELIYGLVFNAQSSVYEFHQSTIQGNTNMIAQVPGLYSIMGQTAVINRQTGRYIFIEVDASNNHNLREIDLLTGALVNTQPTSAVNELAIDQGSGIIYGLDGNIPGGLSLVTIDPTTGNVNPVAALPGITGVAMASGTVSSFSGLYIFKGTDTNNDTRLYSVDLTTGAIVNSPLLTDNAMNLSSSFCYETVGVEELSSTIDIYPNPATNSVTIDAGMELAAVIIYNSLGQAVRTFTSTGKQEISVKDLDAGIYFIAADVDGKLLRRTFVKQD